MTADTLFNQRSGAADFLGHLEPLSLVDPTEAAQLLGVKRHTLACYRSLDIGPPYFKFGKWIRYHFDDLRNWNANPRVGFESVSDQTPVKGLVDSACAARFLGITGWCLTNFRKNGSGPPSRQFGRRHYYPADGLRRWANDQRHVPRCR